MHEESRRAVDPAYEKNQDIVSMADGYPHLIIGEASLENLNQKLRASGEAPVPMDRFRPNLVFEGGSPHEEDSWEQIEIGGQSFYAVKACGRCNLTTVNQETAELGKEPLRTMATYRRKGAKVLFGMNLLHKGEGIIRKGDEIHAKGKLQTQAL